MKRPVASLEVEEKISASASMPKKSFHREYLPRWKENSPPIIVPGNGKYPLPIAPVLVGVRSEEDMLRNIVGLKFMDHDIADA